MLAPPLATPTPTDTVPGGSGPQFDGVVTGGSSQNVSGRAVRTCIDVVHVGIEWRSGEGGGGGGRGRGEGRGRGGGGREQKVSKLIPWWSGFTAD